MGAQDEHQTIASALRTLAAEQAGIAALAASIDNGMGKLFRAAVEMILKAPGRVIVSGMGKSGHVGRKIAATLASTGTPAFFVHPAEASHGDLGMITQSDVILALSWSGETAELGDMIDYSRRFRVGLVGLTSRVDSALGRAADVSLVLPRAEEACPHGLAPTTSTVMQLALGDALAVALLEGRGFSPSDFRVFHPGGKLGARLKQVRDFMHGLEGLPLVRLGASMATALMEMSSKGFGCVGIVDADNRLAGIITDGDLRRHMSETLMANTVDQVMTASPRIAAPDMLASAALEMMNARKITALFVVSDGRPIGLVHLHDLLRAGVA